MQSEKIVAPAPWQLSGEGYVVSVWMPMSTSTPATKIKRPWSRGHIQLLIFANYTQSDVGPYYELLHIPQLTRGVIEGYPSISKIYVSSMASVTNGQKNWGIPKELAHFESRKMVGALPDRMGTEIVELKTTDHQSIARIEFQPHGLKFPISTALMPKRLRTLVQDWQGKRFYTAPEAKGQACFTKVKSWSFDSAYFPDLSKSKVISAIKIRDLEMIFPTAKVSSIS